MTRLALGLAIVLAACAGHSNGSVDSTIGAACTSNGQCDHTCYLDGNNRFPGGFCSVPCNSTAGCPADSECVQDGPGDGLCMFACPAFDCAKLGTNWGCHNVDAYGGGKVEVCVGN